MDALFPTPMPDVVDLVAVAKYLREQVVVVQEVRGKWSQLNIAFNTVWVTLQQVAACYPEEPGSLFTQLHITQHLNNLLTPNEPDSGVHDQLRIVKQKLCQQYRAELTARDTVEVLEYMSRFVTNHCSDDPVVVYKVAKLMYKEVKQNPQHYTYLQQFLLAFVETDNDVLRRRLRIIVTKLSAALLEGSIDIDAACTQSFAVLEARYLTTTTPKVTPLRVDAYYIRAIAMASPDELPTVITDAIRWLYTELPRCANNREQVKIAATVHALIRNMSTVPDALRDMYVESMVYTWHNNELDHVGVAWRAVSHLKVSDRYLTYVLGAITIELCKKECRESTLEDLRNVMLEVGVARINSLDAGFIDYVKKTLPNFKCQASITLQQMLALL